MIIPRLLNFVFLLAGAVLGSVGAFILSKDLIASSVVLSCIPLIQKLIDDLLIRKLFEAIFLCLGLIIYISVFIWVLGIYMNEVVGIQQMTELFFLIIGFVIIQFFHFIFN